MLSHTQALLLVYTLNAPLVVLLTKGIARSGEQTRWWAARSAGLSVLWLADTGVMLWLDCRPRTLAYLALLFAASSMTFPEHPTRELGRFLGSWRFLIFILSVTTVAGLIFLYLPITTFLTSPGELGIHLEYLLTKNSTSAMIVIYLAAVLYAFGFSPRVRTVLSTIALVSVPLALIYSYIYPFGYPPMHGLTFEQIPISTSRLVLRIIVDGTTVGAVTLLTLAALRRFGGRGLVLGLVIINLSLATASAIRAFDEGAERTQESDVLEYADRPLRYSKSEKNVLIVMLDRFMGGYVERIVSQNPEIRAGLGGFVWYPRTVSAGDNSIAGIHPLLGGYDYTPREMNRRGEPLRDVSIESFSILPINFAEKGFGVNFVNPRGLGFTIAGDCGVLDIEGVNCAHLPPEVTRRLADEHGIPMQALAEANYTELLQLLAAMRVAPYSLSAILQKRGPWRPFLDHSAGTTFREWAELKSWPALSRADADGPNLNIVFNILPHEPYFMGDDCAPKSTRLSFSPEEIRRRGYSTLFELQHAVTARCSLQLVTDYFDWMRSEDVYDNTMIIVASDHGIVGPALDRSSRAVAGGTTDNRFVRTRSLLLVKPPGSGGDIRVSEEFMPNAEIPRIVCEVIGGCINPFLGNRTIEAHGRDDPFIISFVPWQFNMQERDEFRILQEVAVYNRDPYDERNWRVLSPDRGVESRSREEAN